MAGKGSYCPRSQNQDVGQPLAPGRMEKPSARQARGALCGFGVSRMRPLSRRWRRSRPWRFNRCALGLGRFGAFLDPISELVDSRHCYPADDEGRDGPSRADFCTQLLPFAVFE